MSDKIVQIKSPTSPDKEVESTKFFLETVVTGVIDKLHKQYPHLNIVLMLDDPRKEAMVLNGLVDHPVKLAIMAERLLEATEKVVSGDEPERTN